MDERNFRPIDVKCCGSCAELKDSDISGYYYCNLEEKAYFNPEDGGEWQHVCNYWRDPKKKISKKNIGERGRKNES